MKTRAFDPETKQWRTDYVVMPDGSVWATEEGLFYHCLPVYLTDWKLSRFTGLLDKNGKEIYEGDILKVTNHDFEVNPNDSDTGYGSVEWLDIIGGWYIDKIHNSLAEINLDYHIEVIGNVFQNPELIEV